MAQTHARQKFSMPRRFPTPAGGARGLFRAANRALPHGKPVVNLPHERFDVSVGDALSNTPIQRFFFAQQSCPIFVRSKIFFLELLSAANERQRSTR
jgi:hypothetical protein